MTDQLSPKHRSGFVAIVGRPNAGKSTLLNQVLGADLSVVSPKAQTTRERLFGILSEEQGQMVFVDTPGIHRAKPGGINAYMVQEARAALEDPNVIWYLVDPFSGVEHEEPVLNTLKNRQAPLFLIWTKSDRTGAAEARERWHESLKAKLKDIEVNLARECRIHTRGNAKNVEPLADLVSATWDLLPLGPRYYDDVDQISDRPLRYFAAERVREQLFSQLGQELPYSCAVEIERFDEGAKPMRIEAQIHVERESQKGMVIGKGGSKIKAIGTEARAAIENFIGTPVFLGLRVCVTPNWTSDRDKMKRLGYLIPAEGESSHGAQS